MAQVKLLNEELKTLYIEVYEFEVEAVEDDDFKQYLESEFSPENVDFDDLKSAKYRLKSLLEFISDGVYNLWEYLADWFSADQIKKMKYVMKRAS